MKIKPLYYFWFFIIIFVLVISLVFYQEQKNRDSNWQFAIKDQVGAQSFLNIGKNLSFDEKNIYFSDGKGLIHALDKNNGQIEWLSQLDKHSPFQINQDQKSLYIASFDSHIYSLDKKNGYINWSFIIPEQFWPDTEVVFDENDQFVFFADRGGTLFALDKKTGQEIWKKRFEAIDSKKILIEKTIHFGFLKQNEDQLIADHFPSETIFIISKKTGEIIEQKKSELKINTLINKNSFEFNKFNLTIEQNIIDQPIINCLDKNSKLMWSYQTEDKINQNEIYQFGDRIYYLNADNNLLTSLYVGKQNPNNKKLKRNNFKSVENFYDHEPYKDNSNPQINIELNKINVILFLKEKIDRAIYLVNNFKEIFSFEIDLKEKDHYLEFDIVHQENFYKNAFTDIKIQTIFINGDGKEIKIDGFYYDKDLWKIRAKLEKGIWKWQTKIKTPFLTKNKNGIIEIKKNFGENLSINEDIFTTNNGEVFFPLGIQDITIDQNKDGNPLNQVGFAKNTIPPKDIKDYNYITFSDYLNLYRNEAKINIFRYGPDNWAPTIWINLQNKNNFKMDVGGNLSADVVLNELEKSNVKIMMSIFAFYPPYISKESIAKKNNQEVLKQYLDYVVSRYASYVDIWELTNEAVPSLEWQNFISDYLSKIDPYKHPITTSLENTQLNNSDLLSIHLYAPTPKDNRELVELANNIQKNQDWKKASIISEFGFKVANYFDGSADLMRKFSWILTFQKNGAIFWNTGDGLFENEKASNIYLGPQERSFLNNLQTFLPKMHVPLKNSYELIDLEKLAVYTMEDQNSKLMYLLNLEKTNKDKYKLPIKIEKKGSLEIINPTNNSLMKKIDVDENTSELTLPYFENDLAIKITYQN